MADQAPRRVHQFEAHLSVPGGGGGRGASFAAAGSAIAILLILVLTACRPGATDAPEPREPPRTASQAGPRLISMGPNITETIFALGHGDDLVGVTPFCDYPPAVEDIEEVGGYLDPNLEKIAVLQPDLLFVQGQPEKLLDWAALQDVDVVQVNMDDLASIAAGIRTIGAALDADAAAEALVTGIEAELDAVREAVAGRDRPSVFIVTGRTSHDLNTLFTAGADSFVSELVAVAGGENVFADAPRNYFEASKEEVVARAPEVILEFHAGEVLTDAQKALFVADWDALPSLPAVANERVHLIMPAYTLRPGPRVGKTARLLARRIHPGAGVAEP
jgi:iron complex transport system substrate-binding protein